MLPSMLLILLLQPLAPAHVGECHRKKTDRHQHEHNVLHTLFLRDNTSGQFRLA
jgi:hypothetical protein